MKLVIAASALLLATQAHALTAYSLGGDTGLGTQADVVTFDAPNAAGVTQIVGGPIGTVGTQMGTSSIAAAPAGDNTFYEAIQPGGSTSFNFVDHGAAGQASVYVGSIDSYNTFEVSTTAANYYYTGLNFLNHNGDQGSLETNRRVYFFAAPGENINSITFGSSGIAFEFDSIAVGAYVSGQGALPPGGEVLTPTSVMAVPEPSTWALMLVGTFAMGASLRSRRRSLSAAVAG